MDTFRLPPRAQLFPQLGLLSTAPLLLLWLMGWTAPQALWLLPILLLLAYLLSVRIARPVAELAEVARRLEEGDLNARPSTATEGDWAEIATAMAALAGRLDAITRHFDEEVGARTAALNLKPKSWPRD